MLIPLKSLIDNLKERNELLEHFLASFWCTKDNDIESFLYHRAVHFENLSKSRTYLVCSQADLENNPLSDVTIYGYISIALKVLTIPNETSNRMRKELDGFNAKIHGELIRDIPCYLIGQLSRNSKITKEKLDGSVLLQYACDVIARSAEAVGGRYIMIECRNNEKLIHFYRKHYFKEFAHIPDNNIPMVQMLRKI